MSAARTCPYDGKKLRSDNTKGICSKCQARGRTLEGAPKGDESSIYDVQAPSERKASTARPAKPSKPEVSSLKRFRVVAEALGEDADALLEAFADSWLEQLRGRLS